MRLPRYSAVSCASCAAAAAGSGLPPLPPAASGAAALPAFLRAALAPPLGTGGAALLPASMLLLVLALLLLLLLAAEVPVSAVGSRALKPTALLMCRPRPARCQGPPHAGPRCGAAPLPGVLQAAARLPLPCSAPPHVAADHATRPVGCQCPVPIGHARQGAGCDQLGAARTTGALRASGAMVRPASCGPGSHAPGRTRRCSTRMPGCIGGNPPWRTIGDLADEIRG